MDSDLRTDACPSPPRDESNEVFETIETPSAKQNAQVPPQQMPKIPAFSNGRFKSQNSRKPTQKTKCDNVIYINKSKDIHIGSSTTYTINVAPPNKTQDEQAAPAKQTLVKTNKMKKLWCTEDPVNRDHLIFISGHITAANWKLMARKLGYSEGQIDHFYADHHHCGTKEVIYQCLLDWIQRNDDKATIAILVDVLWMCEEHEAVELFSHHIYPDK